MTEWGSIVAQIAVPLALLVMVGWNIVESRKLRKTALDISLENMRLKQTIHTSFARTSAVEEIMDEMKEDLMRVLPGPSGPVNSPQGGCFDE